MPQVVSFPSSIFLYPLAGETIRRTGIMCRCNSGAKCADDYMPVDTESTSAARFADRSRNMFINRNSNATKPRRVPCSRPK